MAMPTTTIEVAFTTDPGATPTWTDISAYLKTFTVHRGRADDQSPFGPGQIQLTLANEDRRFDPTYASSPYYPNVIPMRRIRIRPTWNAVTYDLFNGYVTNWRQQYSPPQDAECVVEASDAFKVLANIDLPDSVYEAEVRADAPTHWWRLGEAAGSTVAVDSGTGPGLSGGTYNGGVTLGVAGAPTHDPDSAATFDGIDDFATFGFQPVVTAFPYSLEVWLKIAVRTTAVDNYFHTQNRNVASTNALSGYVSGTGGGDPGKVHWDGLVSTGRIDDGAWHHVVLTATSGAAGAQTLYVDQVAQATGTAMAPSTNAAEVVLAYPPLLSGASPNPALWQGDLDEFATYPVALSSARITAHNSAGRTPWRGDLSGARIGRVLDAAGWPTADRNIDTGQAILQSADLASTPLVILQKIERTEQGALFPTGAGLVRFISRTSLLSAPYTTSQATFGDSGSELEYGQLSYTYDDRLIFNEIRVSRVGGTVQVVKDTTSQTRYLRRTKTFDGLLHQDDSTSLDLANWQLAHYKDPILRVTGMLLEPSAGNEATHFPQVLGRELMDRVTVLRRPQNLGVAISQDTLIEGIQHTVTAMEWRTTWNLSPAEAQAYWLAEVVGHGEAGVNTRAAF